MSRIRVNIILANTRSRLLPAYNSYDNTKNKQYGVNDMGGYFIFNHAGDDKLDWLSVYGDKVSLKYL